MILAHSHPFPEPAQATFMTQLPQFTFFFAGELVWASSPWACSWHRAVGAFKLLTATDSDEMALQTHTHQPSSLHQPCIRTTPFLVFSLKYLKTVFMTPELFQTWTLLQPSILFLKFFPITQNHSYAKNSSFSSYDSIWKLFLVNFLKKKKRKHFAT